MGRDASRPSVQRNRVTNPNKLITLAEAIAMTGLSETKIYLLRKSMDFPQFADIPGNAAQFWLADIEAWLTARRVGGAA